MKKSYLFIIILILLTGAGVLFQLNRNTTQSNIKIGTNIGETAPDFTLNKVNGEEISLSSFRGKKVFLNFWASWCQPCLAEMPDIQRLYEEHKDIQILAVNLQEERGKVINFLMTNAYTFPVVLDSSRKVASDYMVRGIPTSYILDENGIIIDKVTGTLDYQKMLQMLEINE